MTTESPFVSLEDVAKHFAVSVSTMRIWVRNGSIPKDTYFKIGQTYRFDLPKVVAALTTASKQAKAPVQLELDLNDADGAASN